MARWKEITKKVLLNAILRGAAILLVAAMAIILVRFGPGFASDDRDLDPGLSAATRTEMHNQRVAEVRGFIVGLLHGNFGESRTLGVPVRALISERGGTTLRILLVGTAVAWLVGLLWAILLAIVRAPMLAGASTLTSACLLCLPTAAIAALLLNVDWPAEMVLALALVPKVFQVTRGLMVQAVEHSEVLAARSRGLGTVRILGWYVLPRVAGPMLAWMAATAGLAIGAVVPIEVICDVPGLGQLAWKAALARDLPVLVVLTIAVAIIIQFSNAASALAARTLRGRAA